MKKYLQPQKYRLAYQSNNIIRAYLNMSILQLRIYQQALSELSTSMTEFPTTLIPASTFIPWLGNGDSYKAVHAAVDGLTYKALDLVPIKEKTTRTHKIPLMAEVEFVTGAGEAMIRLTFNEKAAPYLLQLDGNFTIIEIEPVLRFKNPNSVHLYEILHSFAGKGKGNFHKETISLDQLKEWLLGNTALYTIFTEFNRRVMKPIEAEFKAIGYGATWKPFKTGKKTTAITFSIPRKRYHLASSDTPSAPQLAAPPTPAIEVALMRVNKDEPAPLSQVIQETNSQPVSPQPAITVSAERIITRLRKLKLTEAQINKVVNHIGNDHVKSGKLMKATHPLLRDFEAGNKVFENLGASTVKLLKTEFPGLYADK